MPKKKAPYVYKALLPEKVLPWLTCVAINVKGYNTQRMMYLISAIVTHKQDKHPGAFSLLNMAYLRNVVPDAARYLNFLKDSGVLEWKNYSAGRNSRMYRLTEEYDGKTCYRTITDMKLNRRIEACFMAIRQRNSKMYPALNAMVLRVKIDIPRALSTVEATYQANPDKDQAEARRTFSLAEISRIKTGDIYITTNTTNFRYDTNYTRLPSELVQYLEIDGHPLTEIDVCNSQPFFSMALFDPTPEVSKVMIGYLGKKFTMYLKTLQLADKEDVKRYSLLVTNGQFYEEMMCLFGLSDRKVAKKLMFTVLFSKNSSIKYSPEVRMFKNEYPNVYRLFAEIKTKEHNRLAILLQRIESHVMLKQVVPTIINRLPEVRFITKHDSLLPASLMVTGCNTEVAAIMAEVIGIATGFAPKLKIKPARAADISPLPSGSLDNNIPQAPIGESAPIATPSTSMCTESLHSLDNE